MITGSITDGGYFVEATVRTNLNSQPAALTFLVDSGASITAIHPADIPKLAIPQAVLWESETVEINGIGGGSIYRLIPGTLTFHDDASETPLRYTTTLYVADLTDDNADIPSLLGRDILNYWRTWQVDVDSGVIGFTVARP
ncbi:MAG: hypothetical protein F4W95_01910 [Chloroflexi bacterium]|nr:hypothetical protein [Chloroflexota bacterium]MYD47222.1 hypothetical protein [Chloroflexota bacterium]